MEALEALEIDVPGPLTTVQDIGRFGYGRYGVAQSGAVDPFALRVANLLVGNPEQAAGLEMTLMGIRAEVLTDVAVAVTGGDLRPLLNGNPMEMWRSHLLHQGDTLAFRGLRSGCRAYLAIGGGLALPFVLGSRSTNLTTNFGGFNGRSLKKGDILRAKDPRGSLKAVGRGVDPDLLPDYGKSWTLRVLWGPQNEDFSTRAQGTFLEGPFRVSPQSDRTGIRLLGPLIEKRPEKPASIISEGVIPGTIQVPPDGRPIIILGETVTGGYRKIATVMTADLSRLGQIKPGDAVHFEQVSVEEAVAILQGTEEKLERFRRSLGAGA